jgi:hypothetical protein
MPLAAGDTRPTAKLKSIVPRGQCFGIAGEVALEAEEGLHVFIGFIS